MSPQDKEDFKNDLLDGLAAIGLTILALGLFCLLLILFA